MARYSVTVPIAGHIAVEVDADSEAAAIDMVMNGDVPIGDKDIIGYETLETFTRGNVCYCPTPWEVTAELVDE